MRHNKRHDAKEKEERPGLDSPKTISVIIATWLVALLLALVPFHGFLTVWGASLGGNYTILRAWNTVCLVLLFCICLVWLVRDRVMLKRYFRNWLVWAITVFCVLQLLFAVHGYYSHTVDITSIFLGLILNMRGPIFLLCTLLVMYRTHWPIERFLKISIGAGILVASFAVLQFTVLPHTFLSHFGYSEATIRPYETINNNQQYIRVASTTRGVNPLGAYMSMLIIVLAALWLKAKPRLWLTIVLLLMTGAMIVSFSRSAWLGTIFAAGFLVLLSLRTKKDWYVIAAMTIVVLSVLLVTYSKLAHSPTVQNIVLHTQAGSKSDQDSNNARIGAFLQSIREVSHEPFGRGVGSAGPASVHNSAAPGRMAENYFVQIAQETGWFGLAVYLGMLGIIAQQLFYFRQSNLVKGLLASFIGLALVNFLSYAWSDDTLVFTWYGLTGLVMGYAIWRGTYQRAIVALDNIPRRGEN